MAERVHEEWIEKVVAELDRPLAQIFATYDEATEAVEAVYPEIRRQVLAEVRETLTTDETLEAAGKATMAEHHFRPYMHIGRTYVEAALATLTEESPEGGDGDA